MEGQRRGGGLAAIVVLLAAAGCAAVSDETRSDARTGTAALASQRTNETGGPPRPSSSRDVHVTATSGRNASSASDDARGNAGHDTPFGKQWIFTEINGFDGALPRSTNASFLMARESGRVIGTTSCNPISGSFEISVTGGTLRFTNLENGSALCAGTNARTEEAVIRAMVATDAFRLSGNHLSLISKGTVIAKLTTP